MVKYSTEELKHFERLAEFFGQLDEEVFVDGEYPFYISDFDLDRADIIKKKVYKKGKRRSVNMYPVSIQTESGAMKMNKHVIKHKKNPKQFHNPFITFTVYRWGDIVTKAQKQFIEDILEGKEEQYSRQLRYKYRMNIQRRLKMAFIGVGGDDMPTYKLGEIKLKMDLMDRFFEASHDNDYYSQKIRENIDKEYISQIVYERLSSEARKDIILYCKKKKPKIESIHLYEFNNILVEDRERFDVLGLS